MDAINSSCPAAQVVGSGNDSKAAAVVGQPAKLATMRPEGFDNHSKDQAGPVGMPTQDGTCPAAQCKQPQQQPQQQQPQQQTWEQHQWGSQLELADGDAHADLAVQPPAVVAPRAAQQHEQQGQPPARWAMPMPLRQLDLRDAIFAGVMAPMQPGLLPPPSLTPRDDPAAGGLLSPMGLDPLALLRVSMLNPELPSPPPPPTEPEPRPPATAAAAASGVSPLAPLSAERVGGTMGSEGSPAGSWQRRRRVSAVLREELAEVAKALETGLPQIPRPASRSQLSALRGPDDLRQQLQLIPTPSGPGSGAATPGLGSPLPSIVLNAGGCSSNVHQPGWQQQQQKQQQQRRALPRSGLAAVSGGCEGSPQRTNLSANPAAEQLAAQVLAAHKGNWVSALHKLASAVGRQLQNARSSQAQPDEVGASRQERDQAPSPGAGQLPEPEIAAREAQLKQVLARGTRAARTIAIGQGAPLATASRPASACATPVSGPDSQLSDAQPSRPGGLGAGAPPVQRQLQLATDQAPDGTGADGPGPLLGAAGPSLPQAWAASTAMPHLRPRPGPSRLAHQSSIHGWGSPFDEDDEDGDLGAPGGFDADPGVAAAPATGAAAAAAVAAVAADAAALEAAAAMADPVLELQHLDLHHPVPISSGASPAVGTPNHHPAGPRGLMGGLQQLMPHPHAVAAHFDEPIISLKAARREARSRSATPAAGNTPRAAAGSDLAATAFGRVPLASAGPGMMDVDSTPAGQVASDGVTAPGAPDYNAPGDGPLDEDPDVDDDIDPIAAQLAGTAPTGAHDMDDAAVTAADLEAVAGAAFDADLAAAAAAAEAAAAAAAAAAVAVLPLPVSLPLPHQAQFAALQQQQQQQQAHLAFQLAQMQQQQQHDEGSMMAFAGHMPAGPAAPHQ